MYNIQQISNYLQNLDINRIIADASGLDESTVNFVENTTKDIMGGIDDYTSWGMRFNHNLATGIISEVWDSLWTAFERIGAPFYKQLGVLNIIKDLEYQKGMKELQPTPLDPATVSTLAIKFPELTTVLKENLRLGGYSEERIEHIMLGAAQPLGDADIRELTIRKHITTDNAVNMLKRLGYDDVDASNKTKVFNTLPGLAEVRDLFLRGEIDEREVDTRIGELGFNEHDTGKLKKLFYYIPPPQDLIRFAVREVFSPAIAEKYGQYEDFPADFERYAAMQGISSDFAKMYWASHWELPSLTMGFEMLHRDKIKEDDLMTLMRAKDVMPAWRKPLMDISYNPLTRVDVRRMYDLGVLDRDDVYKAYKDIGYNDENAERMTVFTEVYTLEHERSLTKSEIVTSFESAMITRTDAVNMLIDMGYSDNEADIILAISDFKREKKLQTKVITAVKKRFKANLIDRGGAYTELASINLPAEEIEVILSGVEADIKGKVANLSKEDAEKAFNGKIITEGQYQGKLRVLGYGDEDISILTQLAKSKG